MIRNAICGLLILGSSALAHDDQKRSDWIRDGGYKNSGGGLCCGFNDCPVVRGVLSVSMPAPGYRLPSGEFVPLSESQPSEDENFYRCHDSYDKRRCFFAPVPKSTWLW